MNQTLWQDDQSSSCGRLGAVRRAGGSGVLMRLARKYYCLEIRTFVASDPRSHAYWLSTLTLE